VIRAGGIPRIRETQLYVAADHGPPVQPFHTFPVSSRVTMRLPARLAAACGALFLPAAHAQPTRRVRPDRGRALLDAGHLLGNVATAVAVMAVAAVGFMMLTGRMNWRFGATVIIGCFILFGAPRSSPASRAAAVG
jgi:type IV secretory pathway VirB2 component (pilin)